MTPEFYTLREVAQIMNIPEPTLYQLSREGRLPAWMGAVRVGSATRFPKKNFHKEVAA